MKVHKVLHVLSQWRSGKLSVKAAGVPVEWHGNRLLQEILSRKGSEGRSLVISVGMKQTFTGILSQKIQNRFFF